MFGKKAKLSGTRVMHYEGLNLPVDHPCGIEMDDAAVTVTTINPKVTITLPIDHVRSMTVMNESDFHLRYHGQAYSTSKGGGIARIYLVIEYISKEGENKHFAVWATISQHRNLVDLQTRFLQRSEQSYSL